ncbi:MAG: class I SAM-dependent methyltransferase [Nanoarchaeota archaeon]|nr:class I SAM-dependent methyltransferase [Nanoarchaeota archaeon]
MKDNKYLIKGVSRHYSKPMNMLSLNRTPEWKLDIASKQKKLSGLLLDRCIALDCCPICMSKEHRLFVSIFDYPFHQCDACGHIFSQRPPATDAIRDLYNEHQDSNDTKAVQSEVYAKKELYKKRVANIARPKVNFVNKIVKEKGRWVDIGAGVGDIVASAKESGWDAIGLESDLAEIRFAEQMGTKLVNAFIDESNMDRYLKGAKLVSLFNVLEHIPSPGEFMRLVSSSIPDGTNVVIEVPRHPSISSFANKAFPEYAARHIYPPDHLHIFTEKSLDIILKENHLNIEAIWLFGQDIFETFSSMAIKGGHENQALFSPVLESVNNLQADVDKADLSDTMIVVAVKRKAV